MTSLARHRLLARAAAHPARSAIAVVAVLIAALLIVLPRPLSPDVAGQLWIADRMAHGARLYLDIREVNPPLWFWLALLVRSAARMVSLAVDDGLIVAIGMAGLASILATDRLWATDRPRPRLALLCYASVILLIVPWRDFGQREQLVLIASVPYAALIARRREGGATSPILAVLIGMGAAAGFALKQYFVGVPVLLEAWLLVGLGRRWTPLRPETGTLVLAALGYFLAMTVLTPGFLKVSVPETLLAYRASGAPEIHYLLRPAQPIWALILYGIFATRAATARPLPALARGLLVAAAGFALTWAIQHKGWPYQSIPVSGTLALALAVQLAGDAAAVPRSRRPVAAAALLAPLLLSALPTQWVPTGSDDITPAIARLNAGDTFGLVSTESWTAWPVLIERKLRFSGRRGSFWIFAAVDANRQGVRDPRIDELGRQTVRDAVTDYRCLPPQRLIFSRPLPGAEEASKDPLRYFLLEPSFRQLLAHYRRGRPWGRFTTFDLATPPEPIDRGLCPRG